MEFLLASGDGYYYCFDIKRRPFFEKPNIPAGLPLTIGLASERVGSSPFSEMLKGLFDTGDFKGDATLCLLLMLFLPLRSRVLTYPGPSRFLVEPLFMIAFRFAFSM